METRPHAGASILMDRNRQHAREAIWKVLADMPFVAGYDAHPKLRFRKWEGKMSISTVVVGPSIA